MVLDVDLSKRRISLGLKQWQTALGKITVAPTQPALKLKGNSQHHRIWRFVGLTEEIDGLVHLSDTGVTGEAALQDIKS